MAASRRPRRAPGGRGSRPEPVARGHASALGTRGGGGHPGLPPLRPTNSASAAAAGHSPRGAPVVVLSPRFLPTEGPPMRWILLLPLLVLLVLFGLSNWQEVSLHLWPLDLAWVVPLSVAVLAVGAACF